MRGTLLAARERINLPCSLDGLTRCHDRMEAIHLAARGKDATTLDEFGMRQYRKLRACFNGRTLYSRIEMFPAGHYMLAGRLHRYWRLPEAEQAPPADEELHGLIRESVASHCIADVPVGSYLSGGLDSTIVAALSHEPHTWTVGLIGSREEQERASWILASLPSSLVGRVWDTTGRLSLMELAQALTRCQVVIGADTGPLHLAAAVGTKVIGWYFARARVHRRARTGRAIGSGKQRA